MKKALQIGNGIAFVSVIVINYLSNTGVFNNTNIGEVSDDLNTLFTPAAYAFSIWGFIYLLLLGFIVYQGRSLFVSVRNDDFLIKTGGWFILSCIGNCAWIIAWLYGAVGLSIIFMFVILISLLRIVMINRMELWDAPISVIVFLWWPFVFYSGWITVASIVNVAAYLTQLGWDGLGLSPITWTLIMIVIATLINLTVTWSRNMREFALVGAWALIAIAVANWDREILIQYSALLAAAILIVSSGIHAFQNRETNPANKCLEYFKQKKS
jgi:hypothetical protein